MFLNESRARVSERCLRQFYWFFLHGGNGLALMRQDKKLTWGILLHAGLAAHYTERSIKEAIWSSLMEEFPNWDDLDYLVKNEWLEEVQWIERVVARYKEWALSRDNFFVEGAEQTGAVVLGESCWQCGVPYGEDNRQCRACDAAVHMFVFRLDLLVRDDYGFRVIDHKSTSSGVDEFYLKSWDFSSQLWGYCYGAEKQSGHPIGGYSINIIRKINAAGEAPDLTKACGGCSRRKIKGCDECKDSATPGRIAREAKPADFPFHREDFSFTKAKRRWFTESRVRAANKIVEHTRRLEVDDPDAFPRNPSACFNCPLTDLCYQREGAKMHEIYISEERYRLKGPDYVSLKRLSLEETA